MKYTLALLLSLGILIHGVAQTQRYYLEPEFNVTGGYLQHLPDNDAVRLFGFGYDHQYFGSARLYTFDFRRSGELTAARLTGPELERIAGFVTLPLPGGNTAMLANLTGCDYTISPTVALIDPMGSTTWVRFSGLPHQFWPVALTIRRTNDSLFQVSAGDSTAYCDWLGNSTTLPPGGQVYHLHMQLPQEQVVAVGSSLLVLDQEFNPLHHHAFASPVVDVDTMPDGFTAMTLDSVFVLDNTLEAIRSMAVPDVFWVQLLATSEHLWLRSDLDEIWQFDHSFQFVDLHHVGSSPSDIHMTDFMHVGDTLFVAGELATEQTSVFCVATPAANPDFSFHRDAGITEIRLADTFQYEFVPQFSAYTIDFGEIYLSIHNPDTVTLDAVTVRFSELMCEGICIGFFQLMWQLTDLGISPGATREVFLDDLVLHCMWHVPAEMCLWISGPNGEPDANVFNDRMCVSIDTIAFTAKPAAEEIQIYPNPAQTALRVQLFVESTDHCEVFLFDACGRTVYHEKLPGNQWAIDVSGLTPGLHTLTIMQSNGNRLTSKVIITGQ